MLTYLPCTKTGSTPPNSSGSAAVAGSIRSPRAIRAAVMELMTTPRYSSGSSVVMSVSVSTPTPLSAMCSRSLGVGDGVSPSVDARGMVACEGVVLVMGERTPVCTFSSLHSPSSSLLEMKSSSGITRRIRGTSKSEGFLAISMGLVAFAPGDRILIMGESLG